MLNQQVNAAGVPDIDNLVRAAHRRLNFCFLRGRKSPLRCDRAINYFFSLFLCDEEEERAKATRFAFLTRACFFLSVSLSTKRSLSLSVISRRYI